MGSGRGRVCYIGVVITYGQWAVFLGWGLMPIGYYGVFQYVRGGSMYSIRVRKVDKVSV